MNISERQRKDIEREHFGPLYDRYSLRKYFSSLVDKSGIKDCLEVPAVGVASAPGIWSEAWGEKGCNVTLVNAPKQETMQRWERMGIGARLKITDADVENLPFRNNTFDLVWNYVVLTKQINPAKVLNEMKRVSRKFVLVVANNRFNWGYPIHKNNHERKNIPWTHGDIILFDYRNMIGLFEKSGLKVVEKGLLDVVPWPEGIGFRDLRLHGKNLEGTEWECKMVDYVEENRFPLWMKLVYLFEKFPTPFFMKLRYSHLYYVLGEV
jgi:hypothetical protein